MNGAPKQPPAAGDQSGVAQHGELAASAERIRETAKWLVASFGAVAAALIAGLQLSDLGKLEGSNRDIAAVGVGVALFSVVMIVTLAAGVLASGRVALGDLASAGGKLVQELDKNPGLYAPYGSVNEFATSLSGFWQKQSKSWLAMQTETDFGKKQTAERDFEQTKKLLPELNRLNSRLLAVARHEDTRLKFERARWWIVTFALLAAAGAGVFAYENTFQKEDNSATAAVAARPALAVADLDPSGQEILRSSLGKACRLDRFSVIAIGSSADGWEVVSLPVRQCQLARFQIGVDDGTVRAARGVELDIPTP